MPQKVIVLCVIVVCVTIIIFTLLTRNSLCEVRLKRGKTEIAALLACESKR